MNIKNVFKILILFLIVLIMMTSVVSAFTIKNISGDVTGASEIKSKGNKIIQIVSTVGSILSVIVIIILGIKYMLGSIEEKASYKQTLVPFIIGAAFIFAASSIASIFYNIAIKM